MIDDVDMALLSPPYPNSFDYTDIYNLELWMLQYLRKKEDNKALRTSTLRSHVQVHRPYPSAVNDTPSLRTALSGLASERDALWNRYIPDMVAGYFGDMERVVEALFRKVRKGGTVVIVVGDSRYGSTLVPVAAILGEIALETGYSLASSRPVRVMRSSPQQGGRRELEETMLTLVR